jgi:hypothetical protein
MLHSPGAKSKYQEKSACHSLRASCLPGQVTDICPILKAWCRKGAASRGNLMSCYTERGENHFPLIKVWGNLSQSVARHDPLSRSLFTTPSENLCLCSQEQELIKPGSSMSLSSKHHPQICLLQTSVVQRHAWRSRLPDQSWRAWRSLRLLVMLIQS